jgi:hypothetical protein
MKPCTRLNYLAVGIALLVPILIATTARGQENTAPSVSLGFTDLKDGTVLDGTTGLMWQKTDSETTVTYSNALTYASDLSTAGHKDWRPPTKFELHSLYNNLSWKGVDHRAPVFGWTEGDWYWSSTRASENQQIGSAGAMPIAVAGGSVDCKSFKNEYSSWAHPDGKNLVRCVRGRVSKEYIEKWSRQLSNNEASKRWEALLTIGYIQGPEAKEALPEIRKLLNDPDKQIKEETKRIVEEIEKR